MEVTIGGWKGGSKSPVCSALAIASTHSCYDPIEDLAFSSLLHPFLRKWATCFEEEDLLGMIVQDLT